MISPVNFNINDKIHIIILIAGPNPCTKDSIMNSATQAEPIAYIMIPNAKVNAIMRSLGVLIPR